MELIITILQLALSLLLTVQSSNIPLEVKQQATNFANQAIIMASDYLSKSQSISIESNVPKLAPPTTNIPPFFTPEISKDKNVEDSWPNCKYNPWKDLPLNQQQEIISHYATRNGCPLPPASSLRDLPPASE